MAMSNNQMVVMMMLLMLLMMIMMMMMGGGRGRGGGRRRCQRSWLRALQEWGGQWYWWPGDLFMVWAATLPHHALLVGNLSEPQILNKQQDLHPFFFQFLHAGTTQSLRYPIIYKPYCIAWEKITKQPWLVVSAHSQDLKVNRSFETEAAHRPSHEKFAPCGESHRKAATTGYCGHLRFQRPLL